jgi:hypothetical protein
LQELARGQLHRKAVKNKLIFCQASLSNFIDDFDVHCCFVFLFPLGVIASLVMTIPQTDSPTRKNLRLTM